MSGVRSYKFITCIFLKNNCRFSCTIQEKFVPLQHSCNNDISD